MFARRTGTSDGSIIAIIITVHIPMNETAADIPLCPGIRIHAIDMVQPPGIGMPPPAGIEADQATVSAVLAMNSSAATS
ncbi:MAG: hypothetical protein ABIX28_15085 [Vicinamibacterales bacterium]